jgi:hypothetical protein
MDEDLAGLSLERFDPVADSGLGAMDALGGGAKAAFFDDGAEAAEGLEGDHGGVALHTYEFRSIESVNQFYHIISFV